jgi:prevent-host-death family protein
MIWPMKTVSIQELKRNLSGYIEQAASGESILVTRHRRTVAKLSPAELPHVRVGSKFGQLDLRPALSKPLPPAAWKLIEDDREESLEKLL